MTLHSKTLRKPLTDVVHLRGVSRPPWSAERFGGFFPMVSYVGPNQSQVRHQEHSGRTPVVASNDGAEAVLQHRIPIFTADLTIETTVAPSFPAKLKHQQKKKIKPSCIILF